MTEKEKIELVILIIRNLKHSASTIKKGFDSFHIITSNKRGVCFKGIHYVSDGDGNMQEYDSQDFTLTWQELEIDLLDI